MSPSTTNQEKLRETSQQSLRTRHELGQDGALRDRQRPSEVDFPITSEVMNPMRTEAQSSGSRPSARQINRSEILEASDLLDSLLSSPSAPVQRMTPARLCELIEAALQVIEAPESDF